MSIGNPIIMAVTPHGPPNSHLVSPCELGGSEEVRVMNHLVCESRSLSVLRPSLVTLASEEPLAGLLRRVVDVIADVVADMVDRGPSYDVEQPLILGTYGSTLITCSLPSPCHNYVSSSQGDLDSLYRCILTYCMGGSLPSATRT